MQRVFCLSAFFVYQGICPSNASVSCLYIWNVASFEFVRKYLSSSPLMIPRPVPGRWADEACIYCWVLVDMGFDIQKTLLRIPQASKQLIVTLS